LPASTIGPVLRIFFLAHSQFFSIWAVLSSSFGNFDASSRYGLSVQRDGQVLARPRFEPISES
jgi:hypothetical protein